MNAITCSDLVKEYRSQKLVKALDGISFDVAEGEIFGLLGPNGAGKTTLVKILTTLLKPTAGHAEVGGYDVVKSEGKVRDIIGYAGQDTERSAYPRLTVRENLLFFAHALRDVSRSVAEERIAQIASGVGFEEKLDKHFSAMSGGEKQLAIVMRAILHDPPVCFLDEPSKSLDPLTAKRVRSFLRNYAKKQGMTIGLTTHNMNEAEEFCDKILFINKGRLKFIGTSADFKKFHYEVVEIDTPNLSVDVEARLLKINGVTKIMRDEKIKIYCDDAFTVKFNVLAVLNSSGIKASVKMVEPSLEDAFAFFLNEGEVKN